MTDYDVPYECACCGKKTTSYLCGLCTTSHEGMKELTRLRAIASRAGDVEQMAGIASSALRKWRKDFDEGITLEPSAVVIARALSAWMKGEGV